MKYSVAAIAFLLLASGVISACVSTPAKPDLALELKTGGGVTGPFFTLVLSPSGTLSVTREALPFAESKSGLTTNTASVQLLPQETMQLLNIANSVDDFSQGCDSVGHGTSTHMRLTTHGKATEFSCNNARDWPVGPHTRELLSALNKHLPDGLQVF